MHALGPCQGQDINLLAGCYIGAAKKMVELEAETITHTCISSDLYGHDKNTCAEIAVKNTIATLKTECAKLPTARRPMYVWFSLYAGTSLKADSTACYAVEFAKLKSGS